jgi:UDPglucose 6-dehydrogenase
MTRVKWRPSCAGEIPIYEPGLEAMVKKNVAARRLRFTTSTEEGVEHGEVIFIAVPTPPQPDGSVDLSFIEKVAREIASPSRLLPRRRR